MTVRPNTTVEDIKKSLPIQNCEIVYAGAPLLGKMSLEFYSVSDGDYLVALDKSNSWNSVWFQVTGDNAAFTERMRMMIDPNMSREYARLRDLRMTKLTSRHGMLSKMESFYESQRMERRIPVEGFKPAILESAEVPSEEPLPLLWDDSDSAANKELSVSC